MFCYPSLSLLLPLKVFITLSLLLIQPSIGDKHTQELINYICHQCEDYGFCYKTFNDNLKTPITDLEGLAQITIELSLLHAVDTSIFVKKLLRNIDDDDDVVLREHLVICDNSYSIVMDMYINALFLFDKRDFREMMNRERPSAKVAAQCDMVFLEDFFSINPMKVKNMKMRRLIGMSVVTAFMLVNEFGEYK